ncbi:MAG TPA: non-reducing end alpha-L-arabinofuranosidase family hydrolase, partial [Polyangiaceae bacterium]
MSSKSVVLLSVVGSFLAAAGCAAESPIGTSQPGTSGNGGQAASAGGSGNASASGGTNASGGDGGSVGQAGSFASSAGMSAGAASSAGGGNAASAGSAAAGGPGSGGTASGGAGAGMGGAGAGGASGACPLPSKFKWTSSGVLAEPKAGWVSLKDFTNVVYDNQHIVYMTTHDTGSTWGAAMFTFGDWPQAATATQIALSRTAVAPTLFYFTPKKQWVLAYQWGGPKFSYATSSDPTDPSKWSSASTLYDGGPSSSTGPIDQTVICDSKNCYLFFATDDGKIHRSAMAIGSFPGTFTDYETIMSDTSNNLFEAVQVYSVKGSDQ